VVELNYARLIDRFLRLSLKPRAMQSGCGERIIPNAQKKYQPRVEACFLRPEIVL